MLLFFGPIWKRLYIVWDEEDFADFSAIKVKQTNFKWNR